MGRKNIENRILLIGSGSWSKNYIKTIQQIDSSELVLHLPARKALIEILKDKNIFKKKIEKEKINKVVICTNPENQYKIIKEIHHLDLQFILEKPLFTNLDQKLFYSDLPKENKKRIFVNHFHFFSEPFRVFVEAILKKKIKKLYIYDYGSGPIRTNNLPLFDWGPHPLGIISFLCPNFKILTVNNIGKDNRQKWFIRLTGDSINEVKILTGNGFKKRKREIYVLDSSNSKYYFKLDDIQHLESPMTSLIKFNSEESSKNNNYANETFNIAFNSCDSLIAINNFN